MDAYLECAVKWCDVRCQAMSTDRDEGIGTLSNSSTIGLCAGIAVLRPLCGPAAWSSALMSPQAIELALLRRCARLLWWRQGSGRRSRACWKAQRTC
eukprot:1158452-Pelagomonas_calceolata.AAC.3